MDAQNLLPQGLVLLVAGMVIVYIFLYLLVRIVRLTADIVPRFNHILPDEAPRAPIRPAAAAPAAKDHAVIAAVVAVAAAGNSDDDL